MMGEIEASKLEEQLIREEAQLEDMVPSEDGSDQEDIFEQEMQKIDRQIQDIMIKKGAIGEEGEETAGQTLAPYKQQSKQRRARYKVDVEDQETIIREWAAIVKAMLIKVR